jgi:protein-disulfide isomerase
MSSTRQNTLILLAIAGALVLQVLLSAALLLRINAVARDITILQSMLSGPLGGQALEGIVQDVPTEGAPSKGAPEAPVTIIVFSDFKCEACSEVWITLDRILEEFPSKVRLVHRDFPLDRAPGSVSVQTANAARCAGEQGLYWEMHDLLYASQDSLAVTELPAYGAQLGLDASFIECVEELRFAEEIEHDQEIGMTAGVGAVPTIFINGRLSQGAMPFDAYRRIVEKELQQERTGGH